MPLLVQRSTRPEALRTSSPNPSTNGSTASALLLIRCSPYKRALLIDKYVIFLLRSQSTFLHRKGHCRSATTPPPPNPTILQYSGRVQLLMERRINSQMLTKAKAIIQKQESQSTLLQWPSVQRPYDPLQFALPSDPYLYSLFPTSKDPF